MLTGHRPAGVGAELEDLVADGQDGLVLSLLEGVEEHQGMEVAVAGVEDVADLESRALTDGADGIQHLGQAGFRSLLRPAGE